MGIVPELLELRVQEDGSDTLIYTFRSVTDAAEMVAFLKDFFPKADFVLGPVRH